MATNSRFCLSEKSFWVIIATRVFQTKLGGIIKPHNLSQFWHRRICEATMFVSGIIIVLYFWTFFAGAENMSHGLMISSNSVILAIVTFMLSLISYLWSPQKLVFPTALTVYGVLVVATATLIIGTSGLSSPFIALWVAVATFAAVFGIYGLVPMFVIGSGYLVVAAINGNISQTVIIVTVVAGYLPLVASYIIWHKRNAQDKKKDRAYQDLASELSQVASKSEVVINAIGDGVIATDNQGVIQLINPAAQRIIGWGKQDAINLNYKSVFKLLDKKEQAVVAANDPVQAVLTTNKEVVSSDFMLQTNSTKKLLVSLVVSPVGKMGSGAIIVFRDVTKEKAEEREQAEFISTASHEMRTPVASIEGYLGLALNPATAQIDDKARDFINKAHESAQHLGRLFQDLLDVTKADDGRLSNNPKVVDVIHFTRDIVEGLRPQADAKKLILTFKPGEDEGVGGQIQRKVNPVYFVRVDNDHLREIIANLIENGIKYTLKGDVVVDVTGDMEHVVISVADSGIGIPTEDIPHLFQKFYRVDSSDTREIGGTGLGLYLCRRLAEALNGRLTVESEHKKGSTFSLELPRISHEEATKYIEAESFESDAKPNNQTPPEATSAAPAPTPTTAPSPPKPPVSRPTQPEDISTISTTQPANQIAQQLKSFQPSAPVPPAAPAPRPVQNQPSAAPPYRPPAAPVSLADIESNPSAYVRPRPTNIVPQRRDQNNQNKP